MRGDIVEIKVILLAYNYVSRQNTMKLQKQDETQFPIRKYIAFCFSFYPMRNLFSVNTTVAFSNLSKCLVTLVCHFDALFCLVWTFRMCKLLRCANFRVALGELGSRTQTRYVSVHSCGTLYSFVNIDNFAVKIIMWKESNTLSHTYVPNISTPQQQQKEKRTLCAGIYRWLPVVNNDLSCRQLQSIYSVFAKEQHLWTERRIYLPP